MLFIKTAGPGVEGVEPYTKWLGRISPHFPPMSHSSLALLGIARGPKPASEGGPCASGAGSGRPLWRHPLPHPSCPPPPFSRLERREGKTRFMGEFNCEQDALFLETRVSQTLPPSHYGNGDHSAEAVRTLSHSLLFY